MVRIVFVHAVLLAGALAQQAAEQVAKLVEAAATARAANDPAAAKQHLREALDHLAKVDPDCRNPDCWWPRFTVGQAAYGLDLDLGQTAWQGVVLYFDQTPAAAVEQLTYHQTAREQWADGLEQRQTKESRARAIELRRKVVAAWEKAGEPAKAGEQLAYLGQAMVQSGEAELGQQGLAMFEAALAKYGAAKPTPQWAEVARLYSIALVDMGRILDDKVLELQEQVLAFYRTQPPEDPRDLVDLLWETANVLQDRGQLMAARRLAQESLDRAVQAFTADHIATFYPRAFYSNLLKNMGDVEQSELLCKANCKLCDTVKLPERHTTRMRAWNNLGHTYLVQGRFQDGVDAFEKGISAIDPQNTDPLIASTQAYTYDNLGDCLSELGRFEEAKKLLQEALAMQNMGRVQRATIEGGMAMVLQRASELEEAARWFDRSIDIVVQTDGRRQPVKYLRRQALTLHALGRGPDLTKCLNKLLVVANRALGECHTLPGRPSYRLATVADDAARTVLSLADKAQDQAKLERQAFEVLESLRGIELRTTHLASRLASSPEFEKQLDSARAARAELARLATLGEGDVDKLLGLAVTRERAEFEALFTAYQKLANQPVRLTVDELAQRLPAGAAIVAYRVLPIIRPDPARRGFDKEELHFEAHLLTKEGKVGTLQRVGLGPAAAIQTVAENWRNAITSGEVRGRPVKPEGPDPAADLSKKIFQPIKNKLGKNKVLIVCLDDVLCTVPIELMPDAEKDGYEFRFTVSLVDLVGTPRAAAAPSLLAVGGIDFDTKPGQVAAPAATLVGATAEVSRGLSEKKVTDEDWPALKESKPEAEAAVARFTARIGKAAHLLCGTDVSREALVEGMKGKRFVHLATHGYFTRQLDETQRYATISRLAPMSLCGLTLSGANETDENFMGVVTGEEIATLDLSGCELAALSACETVHGTSRAGHGLASLQGAFHAAGARYVLATRWKIPDERTKELMNNFYDQLWDKKQPKTPRQALRHAQGLLRDKKVPVKDWAGFVLTGDPR